MRKPKPTVMLAYVYPGPLGTIHHCFHQSVLDLVSAQNPFSVTIQAVASGPLISRARNQIAEAFLASDADYLLFVDTDMQFTTEDVHKLYNCHKPIVGALYFGANGEGTFPTALKQGEDGIYRPVDRDAIEPLMEVDGLGMGLTLIKRDVMVDLGADHVNLWPFAEAIIDGRARGEDLTFCLRAKEAGYSSWLCASARAGHAKTFLV